jgi:hypothetical protein
MGTSRAGPMTPHNSPGRRRDPAAVTLAMEAPDATAPPPTPGTHQNPSGQSATGPAAWAVQDGTLPAPGALTAADRFQRP